MLDETTDLGCETVAILSSAGGGGAGIAAHRLTHALNETKRFKADFLTSEALGGFLSESVAPMISVSNRKLTDTHYTIEYPGLQRQWLIDLLANYDVINIHWASYLLGLSEIHALAHMGKRILFMLHDFHYITGGCHYPAGCKAMSSGCLNCPQVDETLCDINYVPRNLRAKRAIFANPNVHLAAPSQFLCDQAISSGIVPKHRTHVLRNAYVPMAPAKLQRRKTGTYRLVLIADSLTEHRKGMPLALESLDRLSETMKTQMPDTECIVDIVGHADDQTRHILSQSKFRHEVYGRITEHEKLVDIFCGADLLLTCSYEDNWPNILVEAGAYGCVPIVGPGHGCEEFVSTYGIGEVVDAYTPDAFAQATIQALKTAVPDRKARTAFINQVRADHHPTRIAQMFSECLV